MSTTVNTQEARVKEIVCDVLELETDEVTPTSLFIEEHGADSLLAIEMLAALERAFDVTIEQDQLARMINLEGVQAVVDEAIQARS